MSGPKVMVCLHPVACAAALWELPVREREKGEDKLEDTNSKHFTTRSRQTFN